jgi:hypothetical protein
VVWLSASSARASNTAFLSPSDFYIALSLLVGLLRLHQMPP